MQKLIPYFVVLSREENYRTKSMPAKAAPRAELLARCDEFFPVEIQKLIQYDENEKKKIMCEIMGDSIDFINIFT